MTKRKTTNQAKTVNLKENVEVLLETDQQILDQIDKRKEENQALKKLLDNLNTPIPKPGAGSPKR